MRTLADAVQAAHRGSQSSIPCPAHDDSNPSLSVGPGDSQDVVVKCFAGCSVEDILAAEGLEWADICRPREDPTGVAGEWTPRGEASHIYDYTDSEGNLILQVLRVPQPGGKTFTQRHWDETEGKWKWSVRGLPKPLYRLVEVDRAVQAGKVIHVTEGEKDVEVLRSQGLVATTSLGGAGKWDDGHSETLSGSDVIVWADADESGRKHARQVMQSLMEHDCHVRVLESTIGKDAADHYARGGTIETAVEVANSHPERKNQTGMGIRAFLSQDWGEDEEIIPGHLARSNIAIITGWEGQGKSTFLRELAATAASGINMLANFAPMAPLKVLYIDAENPEHQLALEWRQMVTLADGISAGPTDRTLILMNEWEAEPDLGSIEGQAWLNERISAYRPDLCIMGPVQNLVSRDVKDDEVVRRLKRAVNTARSICGTAFILEHHAPHRASGDKERTVRPYGSSLFLKWPDYGYGLRPDPDREGIFDLVANRKPRVRKRAWPTHFKQGDMSRGDWPWEPHLDERGAKVIHGGWAAG